MHRTDPNSIREILRQRELKRRNNMRCPTMMTGFLAAIVLVFVTCPCAIAQDARPSTIEVVEDDAKYFGKAIEPQDTITIVRGQIRPLILKKIPRSVVAIGGGDAKGRNKATVFSHTPAGRLTYILEGARTGLGVMYFLFDEPSGTTVLPIHVRVVPQADPGEKPPVRSKSFQRLIRPEIKPVKTFRQLVGRSRFFPVRQRLSRMVITNPSVLTIKMVDSREGEFLLLNSLKPGRSLVCFWFEDLTDNKKRHLLVHEYIVSEKK